MEESLFFILYLNMESDRGENQTLNLNPDQIIENRLDLWSDLGVVGISAYEVVDQSIKLLGDKVDDINVSGLLGNIENENQLYLMSGQRDRFEAEKRVVYEIGEMDGGIQALEGLATGYLGSTLVLRQYKGKTSEVVSSEFRLANLAMARLAELYEQGKCEKDVIERIKEGTLEVIHMSENIIPDNSDVQFGWKYIWKNAVEINPEQNWQKVAELLTGAVSDPSLTGSAKNFYLIDGIFVGTQMAGGSQDKTGLFVEYFSKRENRELYKFLSRNTFLALAERKLDEQIVFNFYPQMSEIGNLFLDNEGLCFEVIQLAVARGVSHEWLADFLSRSIYKLSDDEFETVMDYYDQYNLASLEPIGFNLSRQMLKVLDFLRPEDMPKYARLFDNVCPEMLVVLDSQGELGSEGHLETMIKLAKVVSYGKGDTVATNIGILIPLMYEKMLEFSDLSVGDESFCGNIAADILNEVTSFDVPVYDVLQEIRSFLHISRLDQARDRIEGLYDVFDGREVEYGGVSKQDMIALFDNFPNVKPKLDLIRQALVGNRVGGPSGEEANTRLINISKLCVDQVVMGKDVFRRLIGEVGELVDKAEIDCRQALTLVTKAMRLMSNKDSWILYPALLALRRRFMMKGIDDSFNVDEMKLLADVGLLTGELPKVARGIGRSLRAGNIGLVRRLTSSGFHTGLDRMRKSLYRNYDTSVALEKYRSFQSKSILDFMYRGSFVIEESLQ